MKKRQTYKNTIPSHETISLYPEYWRLVEWISTPSPLRKPATLGELAKELSVHYTTLSRWQNCVGFDVDVRQKIKQSLKSDLSNVLYALRKKIFSEGNAKEVKLFLEWVDEWTPKTLVEHTGKIETEDPQIREIVRKFELELKEKLSNNEK